MRVCLIARRFYESNTHMQQFAKALADRGDSVDVIAARRPGLPAYQVCDGVNVYRIQTRKVDERGPLVYGLKIVFFLLHAAVFIARRHLRNRYDLIHVQSIPDVLVFSALLPKLLGARVILDLRDLVPELAASKLRLAENSLLCRLLRFVERRCASFADHVIVANPIWYDRVVSRSANPSRCSMLWYSPDPRVFYSRSRRPQDGRFVMLYPGTLSRHQGVDIVIRALPKIRAAIPHAELHIYAEGNARNALAVLARELDVAAAVRFFDVVPTATLVERMAASDLAVVPKRASERFGNEAASTKIPEFMAVGVPVVASRTAIEMRFFNDSHLCYFRSEDEDDLVRAVVSVYCDPALRNRLSRNARVCVEESAGRLREEYLNLVDELVAGKSRQRRRPMNVVDHYYTIRPLLPRSAQIAFRRNRARDIALQHRTSWPVPAAIPAPPPGFPGWPNGKRFALVLTHDVERGDGISGCERLASLEEERGLRSSFAFVPLRYETPETLRHTLLRRGFEIMVHDLYHDGKLFRDRKTFEKRLPLINEALHRFSTRGFASGAMHHNLSWINALDVDFDMSTFDVDPFEPQRCGLGRIFPFCVGPVMPANTDFIELPYTLPQDFTLFVLLRERTTALWRQKLDWIAGQGGMALIKTHPDYMSFGSNDHRVERYPVDLYTDFLDYIVSRYGGEFWLAPPSEIASYWRTLQPPDNSANTIAAPPTLCPRCCEAHAAGLLKEYPTATLATNTLAQSVVSVR